MESSSFYLTIIAEVSGIFFLILIGYSIILKKDIKKLLSYVTRLKEINRQLKKKLNEQNDFSDPRLEFFTEVLEYIKTMYEEKFGHPMGTSAAQTSMEENISHEHFLYVLSYQFFKAELSALENSSTAEKFWEKIVAQISVLIKNYQVIPDKQFDILVQEKVESELEYQRRNSVQQGATEFINRSSDTISGQNNNLSSATSSNDNSHFFEAERKKEIDRLKRKVSSQFEDIFKLQLQLSNHASTIDDSMITQISTEFDVASRQLKDAELCISMMDAEIAEYEKENLLLKEELEQSALQQAAPSSLTQDEQDHLMNEMNNEISSKNNEIITLKEQLKQTLEQQNNDESMLILENQIAKKDNLITRFSQESKEMIMLITELEDKLEEKNQTLNKES